MIEARGLTKFYGERAAVFDLSFTIRPGIVTGFLGPNGAGKSTTMRLILGLDSPSAGSVRVNGRRYADYPAPPRTSSCWARGGSSPIPALPGLSRAGGRLKKPSWR